MGAYEANSASKPGTRVYFPLLINARKQNQGSLLQTPWYGIIFLVDTLYICIPTLVRRRPMKIRIEYCAA